MKIIISKKCKKKKNKFLKNYWKLEEPKEYVDKMVAFSDTQLIKIASKLKGVDLHGTLKQKKKNGFVYIGLSNDVIHGLFTLIDEERIEKPPYFNDVGCHISAISDEEIEEYEIEDIKEIGQDITFRLGEMYSTKPTSWDEMERVYFVQVDCPEIEKIRKSYGLPKSYNDKNQSWHITLAVKKAKK